MSAAAVGMSNPPSIPVGQKRAKDYREGLKWT